MNRAKNFYNLAVWQQSHQLTLDLYEFTAVFPKEEIYGITSQLRRAASSVEANIAEGFGRYHYRDKQRFYYQARGSLAEVQNFIILAEDLKYLGKKKKDLLWGKIKNIEKMLNGLISSMENKK